MRPYRHIAKPFYSASASACYYGRARHQWPQVKNLRHLCCSVRVACIVTAPIASWLDAESKLSESSHLDLSLPASSFSHAMLHAHLVGRLHLRTTCSQRCRC